MAEEKSTCALCGEPMPAGEEMFQYHGYSGPCPKPPKLHPYQQRVVDEKKELDDKIDKLAAFRDGNRFQTVLPEEQKRLKDQLQVMREYSHILAERILHFK